MKRIFAATNASHVKSTILGFPGFLWILVAWSATAWPVRAATTHTWTGGGSNGNWSVADNWTDGLPGDDDNLIFSGTIRQTNQNDLLTSVGSVVISEAGFEISGNPLTLKGPFGSTGDNTWSIPLTLTSTGKYIESLNGTLVLDGNIANGGNTPTFKANYGVGVNGPITVAGVISGTGGLIKDGSGGVTITCDNTYSGKTTLSKGHLIVSADSHLGTAPASSALNIELNGGFLEAASTFTLNSKRLVKIIASGGYTGFWANNDVTLTYGGVISAMNTSSTYGLRLDGGGTIVLSGANTYRGRTTIFANVVRISNANAFGNYIGTAVEVQNLSSLELTGNITVGKPLSLDYANLVNLSGNNTWSGEVTVLINTSGKSIVRAEAETLLTMSGNIYINTDTETSPLNQMENLYVEGAGDIEIAGLIDGNGTDDAGGYLLGHGDVVMNGTGTLTLSGENSYSGRTLVNSGCMVIGADSNMGVPPESAQPGRLVIDGGTLSAVADFTLDGNRGMTLGPVLNSGSGTVHVASGVTVLYSGIIADNDSGTGGLNKAGPGTLVLSGANTYSGPTTIGDGTLLIANESGSGTGTGPVTVNETGTLGGTGTIGGSVTAASGGTVAPGMSGVGTLSVGGDVTFESGSTYEVEIGDGTTCDVLNLRLTGNLTLGNSVSTLDIGTLSGSGRTIAVNVKPDGVSGYFQDTSANALEDGTALHLQPDYYIHYVDKPAGGYVVLNTTPTAADVLIRAYEAASGVVVEFQTIEEAGQNDIVLLLFREGRWVEIGRKAAAGGGSHSYPFQVPGLQANDIVDIAVQDDEGNYHTAFDLTVGKFAAKQLRMQKNGMKLQWDSIPGRTYDVYFADQLCGPWDIVATVVAVQDQTESLIPGLSSRSSGFFKIGMRD